MGEISYKQYTRNVSNYIDHKSS